MNKFEKLYDYLIKQKEDTVVLSLEQIENDIIEEKLPESSRRHRAYFANTTSHSISKSWLKAGFRVIDFNRYEEKIVFGRIKDDQSYLLSSEVLCSLIKKQSTLKGFYYVSVFSLYECLALRGLFQKDVFDYLSKNKIKIVDLNGKLSDFDSFIARDRVIETLMKKIYNSTIQYSLLNCLINSFRDTDLRTAIFDLFSKDSATYLVTDFPISTNKELGQPFFDRKLKTLLDKANMNFTYDEIINLFAKLEYKDMSLVMISGITNMETNYINYMLKDFLDSCKEKTPYMDFTLINEMFNVDILSIKKELVYWTNTDKNFDVLIGSIKNRVIRKEIIEEN